MADTAAASSVPASLSDPPRPGQRVLHDGREYTTVKEGKAHVLFPPNAATSTDPKKQGKHDENEQKQSVFYNPIQQFNRDLSVLAIRAYGEDAIAAKVRKHQREQQRDKKRSDRKRKARAEHEAAGEAQDNKRSKVDNGAEIGVVEVDAADNIEGKTANKIEGMAEDKVEDANAETTEQTSTDAQKEPVANGSSKGPKFRILDALSASGLRALRYAHEIPFTTSVTANDLSPSAIEAMKLNIKHNKLEDKITPTVGNAVAHMYQFVGQEGIGGPGHRYDVIDLDPYGTAVPFLDAAVQAVTDGGLLCVTCTDAGVFASTGYIEKAYSLYGGLPVKGLHSHEGGLRLILYAISTAAAKYGIAIEPLLSLSIDFYARVFVRVRKSPAEVKFLAGKQMLVYNCDSGCGSWTTQPMARNLVSKGKNGSEYYKYGFAQGPTATSHCHHCGFKTHLCGPVWGGPLHNPAFIEKILSYLPDVDRDTYHTTERIEGMLRTAHEELLFDNSEPYVANPNNPSPSETAKEDIVDETPKLNPLLVDHHPFYLNVSHLAKIMHSQAPPEAAFKGALRKLGYRATRSHCKPAMVKTDAPWEVIWEVMREWVRQKSPVEDAKYRINTPGRGIWEKRRRVTETAKKADGEQSAQNEGEGEDKQGEEKDDEMKDAEKMDVDEKKDEPEKDDDDDDDEREHEKKNNKKRRKKKGKRNDGDMSEEGEGVDVTTEGAKAKQDWSLEKLHQLDIVFDEKLGKDKDDKKLVRYQMNPRANWGPMNRAK